MKQFSKCCSEVSRWLVRDDLRFLNCTIDALSAENIVGLFEFFSLWEHFIAMNDKSYKLIHSCYNINVTYYMLIKPSLPGPSKVILTKRCDTFTVPRHHVMVLDMKWQNWELEGNCGEKWTDCVWGVLRTVSSWQHRHHFSFFHCYRITIVVLPQFIKA